MPNVGEEVSNQIILVTAPLRLEQFSGWEGDPVPAR